MSVGVKGLRVGVGPRGHYVHAGRGGLYYRATLGKAGQKRAPSSAEAPRSEQPPFAGPNTVEMVQIDSGDVLTMRDATVSELIDDINAKGTQTPLGKIVGWSGVLLGGAACLAQIEVGLVVWLLTLPAWLFARWLDSYKRRSVVFYDLEPDATAAFERLTVAFDELSRCGGIWHVAAGGHVKDLTTWKRNAGASHIVDKKPTVLTYGLPKVISCNVTPPSMQVGVQTLHFLPDILLVVQGKRVGAVGYADLALRWQDSNFIEEGKVPSDATVVWHTWKHPNKSGGPDRRFSNNYQIPVCRYEALHLSSTSGLNELLEFSRTGVSAALSSAVAELANLNGRVAMPQLTTSTS